MQSKIYSFCNLDVWQDSQALAAEVIGLLKALRKDVATTEISKQLVRSAGSAPANIAEGHGRFSEGAYRNHLLIARGSLAETASWLDLLRRCDYLDRQTEEALSERTSSLIGRLGAKARTLDKRPTQATRAKEPSFTEPDRSGIDDRYQAV
jgi:four helix bundle protein